MMKNKFVATLALLSASVFAFAGTENSDAKQPAADQQKCAPAQACKKGPKAMPSPEQREAFVQRVLLSLDDKALAKLAERVAEIQKMTPEQKAEALKALPKPEVRGNKKPCGPRGDRRCPPAPMPQAKVGCPCGPQQGAPLPPPPPAPKAPEAGAPAPEAPAAPAAPAAESK